MMRLFIVLVLLGLPALGGCVTAQPRTLNIVPDEMYLEANVSDPDKPDFHVNGGKVGFRWKLEKGH